MKCREILDLLKEDVSPDEEVLAIIITKSDIERVGQNLIDGKWIKELPPEVTTAAMGLLYARLSLHSHDTDIERAILSNYFLLRG